jgi:hypothetical protein
MRREIFATCRSMLICLKHEHAPLLHSHRDVKSLRTVLTSRCGVERSVRNLVPSHYCPKAEKFGKKSKGSDSRAVC